MNTAAITAFPAYAREIEVIQRDFECSYQVAECIADEARRLGDAGRRGELPPGAARYTRDEFADIATAGCFGGVDKHDLGDYLREAWMQGVTSINRLTVHMDSTNCDADCYDCGANLSNGSDECDACGSDRVVHHVDLTVEGPFVNLWTQAEPFVDGGSWETDGTDYATVRLPIRAGLTEDLQDEGYVLDQSNYAEPEEE